MDYYSFLYYNDTINTIIIIYYIYDNIRMSRAVSVASATSAVRKALDYAEDKKTLSRSSSNSKSRQRRRIEKLKDLRQEEQRIKQELDELVKREQERQRQEQLYIQQQQQLYRQEQERQQQLYIQQQQQRQWQQQQRQLYQQHPPYPQYPKYHKQPMYRQYKQPPHLLRQQHPRHPPRRQHPPLPQRIDLKDLPADKYCKDKGYEKKRGFANARISLPPPPPEREDIDAFCKRHHFVIKSQTNTLSRKAQQPIVLKIRVSRTKTKVSPNVSTKTKRVSPKASKAAKAAKASFNVPKVLHTKPVSNKHITV